MNRQQGNTKSYALIEGPFDGQTIELEGKPGSLVLSGDGVPEGMVARYRPTRAPGAYRFRGWDRVVGTIPMPVRKSSS